MHCQIKNIWTTVQYGCWYVSPGETRLQSRKDPIFQLQQTILIANFSKAFSLADIWFKSHCQDTSESVGWATHKVHFPIALINLLPSSCSFHLPLMVTLRYSLFWIHYSAVMSHDDSSINYYRSINVSNDTNFLWQHPNTCNLNNNCFSFPFAFILTLWHIEIQHRLL